jgi:hypothetical protein
MGKGMQNQEKPAPSKPPEGKRRRPLLSRPRIVLSLLLIVAIPIFISLANKAVRENAAAIRQGFGQ